MSSSGSQLSEKVYFLLPPGVGSGRGDGLDGEVVCLASAALEAFDADEGTGGFAGWVHAETIGGLWLAGGGIYHVDDGHLEARTGRFAGF